jgi:hypothetical protein
MVSQSEIIQQLNYAARSYGIPMLDIYYPIAARMSAYRTVHHWGLVIEVFEFNGSCFGHACPRTRVYCFGDALQQAPGRSGLSLHVTGDGPSGRLFDSEGAEQSISSSARDMAIRGKIIPITIEPLDYAKAGIKLEDPPRIHGYELLRLLVPRYHELFFATESELAERLGEAMPLLVRFSEWLHCDWDMEMPGDCEAFQMIADAIAHNDPGRYRPTQRPNTHWSNWPDAPVV